MNQLLAIFKNRFFIICLCAALLLSILPAVLAAMGLGSYVRAGLQAAASPFQWCFTKIGEGLGGYAVYFRTTAQLREENRQLREELDRVQSAVYDAELIDRENSYLRGYLAMKSEHSDFHFSTASVIGRESTNYRTVYTLSKGSMHGIEKNMPVVTEQGLIGHVTEVGPTWCRAETITETASSVGAYTERTEAIGIVGGDYTLRFEGKCLMSYIDGDSDVAVGDKVLTSGVGSIYPRGILIGTVTLVSADPVSRTVHAVIEPAADLSNITRVMIITEYSVCTDETNP